MSTFVFQVPLELSLNDFLFVLPEKNEIGLAIGDSFFFLSQTSFQLVTMGSPLDRMMCSSPLLSSLFL